MILMIDFESFGQHYYTLPYAKLSSDASYTLEGHLHIVQSTLED